MLVREAHRIEIRRPIAQQHRITRVIRRQRHLRRIRRRPEFRLRLRRERLSRRIGAAAEFAARQLHLHEKRLPRLPPGPVVRIVNLRVPLEIVVGLAKAAARAGLLRLRSLPPAPRIRQPAADARIISGLLKNRRYRDDPARQHDLLRPAPAPMVVRTDRRLIHPRDQPRATRRTHRRRRKSTGEPRAFPRQPIHVRRRDQLLPVTRKICRHVVDDEPQDIRPPFGGRRRTDRDERTQGQQHRAEDFHGGM